jgi:hypothetical protein
MKEHKRALGLPTNLVFSQRLGFSFSKAAELAAARKRLADNSPQRQESFVNDSQRIK